MSKGASDKEIRCADKVHDGDFPLSDRHAHGDSGTDKENRYCKEKSDDNDGSDAKRPVYFGQGVHNGI